MDAPESFSESDIEEFRPALLLLARSQLGMRFRRVLDDSDIVQQTLLEAHAHQASIREQSPAERFAWLRRVLTNTILDNVRKHTRGKRNVEKEVELEAQVRRSSMRAEQWLTDRNSSPVERAERNEQLQSLAAALQALPEAQREAIELFHLQGCTLPEVAGHMKRTGAAVAGLIHRGLKQLRQTMKADDSLAAVSTVTTPVRGLSEDFKDSCE